MAQDDGPVERAGGDVVEVGQVGDRGAADGPGAEGEQEHRDEGDDADDGPRTPPRCSASQRASRKRKSCWDAGTPYAPAAMTAT